MVAIGTVGDVLPFLGISRALSQAGFVVTLLSNMNHAALAARFGLAFHAIAPPNPPQTPDRLADIFAEVVAPSFAQSAAYIMSEFEAGRISGVVAHDLALGALSAAERINCPLVKIVLAPCGFPATVRHTKVSTNRKDPSQLRELELSNAVRRSMGLSPLSSMLDFAVLPTRLTLGMFPDTFATPHRTLWNNEDLPGFPFVETESPNWDEEAVKFLAHRERPIVATPGTGVRDVAGFFSIIDRCRAQFGLRAVYLSPHITSERFETPNVLIRDYMDLGRLLPFASVVIHHGGVGTTAQALRAGKPQIIRPALFDQPDNARRVARLGLGRILVPQVFSEETLGRALAWTLSAKGLEERLRAFAAACDHDGVLKAASAIKAALCRQ